MTDLKLSTDIREFLYRPTTVDFLRAARQLVALLEIDIASKNEFLKKSHAALIDLYAAGHKLEEVPLKYSNTETEFDREKLFEGSPSVPIPELGEEGWYWEVFDPTYVERDGRPGPRLENS